MSKGYATTGQVAAFMGIVFTPAQELVCEAAIGVAESWIDNEIEHAWLETGPITEDIYNPQGVYIHLRKAPIVSVTSIDIFAPLCSSISLIADSNYFVQSLRDGRIYSPYTRGVYKMTVVYVPNADTVPDEIMLATMALAAGNMRMAPAFLDGVDPSLVQRYNVGGELEVEFRKNLIMGGVVPQQVLNYLDSWRKNYAVI